MGHAPLRTDQTGGRRLDLETALGVNSRRTSALGRYP